MNIDVRMTVCISAHYAPHRVPFLDRVLNAIAGWPVSSVTVQLLTNDATLMVDPQIIARQQQFSQQGWRLTHEQCRDLTHPFLLTWEHKRLIPEWLSVNRADGDLFIYLEDDIALNNKNIKYLLETIPILKPRGLIPSFLRYEEQSGRRVFVDITEPQLIFKYRSLKLNGLRYVSTVYPYWGGFFLDQQLAEEYLRTDSFDLNRSTTVTHWDVRERAAMGLTWENVPRGFRSRFVVPLIGSEPIEQCQVWHASENYSADLDSQYGKLDLAHLFVGHDPQTYYNRASRKVRSLGRQLFN